MNLETALKLRNLSILNGVFETYKIAFPLGKGLGQIITRHLTDLASVEWILT